MSCAATAVLVFLGVADGLRAQIICHAQSYYGGGSCLPLGHGCGMPILGTTFNLDLRFATPGAPNVLFIGASRTQWGTLTLPADLTPLGAAGCWLLTSGELQFFGTADANGRRSVSLTIPNSLALCGRRLWTQYIEITPRLVTSNGWALVTGLP